MNATIDRPAWLKTLARIAAVPAGIGLSLFAAVVGFAALVFQGCEDPIEDGSTFICDHFAAVVPAAAWLLASVAVLAPFCGGAAAAATGRARWFAIGSATCVVACVLMLLLGSGLLQTGTLG